MCDPHPTLRFGDLWRRKTESASLALNGFQLYYTYNARAALYQLLRALPRDKRTTVLLPAFHCHYDGVPTELMTICVDQTEFVVNKLKDRGTHQAYGVVTNAQDFMHVLRFYVEKGLAS